MVFGMCYSWAWDCIVGLKFGVFWKVWTVLQPTRREAADGNEWGRGIKVISGFLLARWRAKVVLPLPGENGQG